MFGETVDGLPNWPHEGAAILALAYWAGLASNRKIKCGVRLVPKKVDLFQGTDADWVWVRSGRRDFLRLDFTTGGKKTIEEKETRSEEKFEETGREVKIVPFSPVDSISLLADPCFHGAWESLTAGAEVGWGSILRTTHPCPKHGDRCSLCEKLLILGKQLHDELPEWAQVSCGKGERRLLENFWGNRS